MNRKVRHLEVWPIRERIVPAAAVGVSMGLLFAASFTGNLLAWVASVGMAICAEVLFDSKWREACKDYGVDGKDTI